ncbi:serine hydrolase domain-containing protein [Niabella yanshanensis]|uniref:Serine hydrolase domain-containing protein n=1 Tax=Niabella yanshanensis TaxID=577386 RepID=A0ABZ0W1D7_9BACT|nr:serine hydrolase domain-containing protein [Niabella yanshanensis]WQD36996.1 serine hydrolase domain-containing protein [Niabella yanshanensis]
MKKCFLPLLILFTQAAQAQIQTYSGKKISAVAFTQQIIAAMDSLKVPGMSVAVINKGKIVFTKGLGWADIEQKKPVTPATFFEAASLSKPAFAFFVLTLAHKGVIDLDKPLFEYLPATHIADERYKKITARMVLAHTTGLPNWSEGAPMQLEAEPGARFSYSGEAYVYLAKVIAHLKGLTLETLDALYQKEVARQAGLKDFHFVMTPAIKNKLATPYQDNKKMSDDRNRHLFDPAGGLYANAGEYAKFLCHLMKQQPVLNEMMKPVIELEKDHIIRKLFGVDAWSMGLAVIPVNNTINYWHGGNNLGYTASFMINPEKKFGYVFFTNADQCNGMKQVLENILWK